MNNLKSGQLLTPTKLHTDKNFSHPPTSFQLFLFIVRVAYFNLSPYYQSLLEIINADSFFNNKCHNSHALIAVKKQGYKPSN